MLKKKKKSLISFYKRSPSNIFTIYRDSVSVLRNSHCHVSKGIIATRIAFLVFHPCRSAPSRIIVSPRLGSSRVNQVNVSLPVAPLCGRLTFSWAGHVAVFGKYTGRRGFAIRKLESTLRKGSEPHQDRTKQGRRDRERERERERERKRMLFLCTAWPAAHVTTSQGHCTRWRHEGTASSTNWREPLTH